MYKTDGGKGIAFQVMHGTLFMANKKPRLKNIGLDKLTSQ